MTTTILSSPQQVQNRPTIKSWIIPIINLILAGIYGILLLILLSNPVRHGFGQAMVSILPLFMMLFCVLTLAHSAMVIYSRLSEKMVISAGIILMISTGLIVALLLFSRPAFNFILSIFSGSIIPFVLLSSSLCMGGYVVVKSNLTPHPWVQIKKPGFPLSPDRYADVTCIATGGVGTIWYAIRKIDDKPVILKVPIQDDEKTGMSFLQELSLWKELTHPNIVRVYAVNILPVPYIEMEFLESSLADMRKPVSLEKALQIIFGVCSGLAYAHERGIIHCDLKPTNILMNSDEVPKLSDWGLSRTTSSRWIVPGFSPRYAAPEQHALHGECSMETDIWQIGLILAELLTGKAEKPSGNEPIFHRPGGSDVLNIINRCLAHDRKERYPNAMVLMDHLNTVL